jgi:putative sterol carrier protein
VLHITNGQCSANEGLAESPTLTLRMSSETYIGMAIGKLKGPQAFFLRKLRFEGETKLLMKMHSLFPSLQKSDLG